MPQDHNKIENFPAVCITQMKNALILMTFKSRIAWLIVFLFLPIRSSENKELKLY